MTLPISEIHIIRAEIYAKKIESIYSGSYLIDLEKEKKIQEIIKERERGIPLAYLLENKEFFGRKFYVNKNVLIPRPDTESLIEETLKNIPRKNAINIIDMCSGSGCIGITISLEILKTDPNKQINLTLCDISDEALKVSERNCQNLLPANIKVTLIQSDLYDNLNNQKYDIFATNPPYVETEFVNQAIQNHEEISYEPRLALDGGSSGLDIYKKIFEKADRYLNKEFFFILESDPSQTTEIEEIYKKSQLYDEKYLIKPYKDLSGNDRGLYIQSITEK